MAGAVTAYATDEERNLQSVRKLLTNQEKMHAAIQMLCESDKWDGMLARRGNQMSNSKDKELASTLTTTNRFMRFLDTVAVSDNTKQSSFDPAELLTGKMTIYLVLPPEHMRTQSALLRLWIGSLLRSVIRGGLQEKTRVHFVCDEANSLGKMDQVSDMLTIGRGYGIRLQLYYQDCGQIKKCWPDGADQTIFANTTQVFFGCNDQATAEYVSNRLGEKTIIIASGGSGTNTGTSNQSSAQGSSNSYSTGTNTSQNWQMHARKLLKPEEVMALDPRIAITFAPGVPPISTRLVRYYENGFKARRNGLLKMGLEALCMLMIVAVLAAVFAAAVCPSLRR